MADSGDLESDLPALFLAIGEAARARKTAVAIIIDELQYLTESEFSALIMALHKIAQKGLPLILVGAGLPQVVGLAGRSKSYAERLFDYPEIGPLSPEDARQALAEPAERAGVAFLPEAIDAIYAQTQGYPYFLQEWGYQAWNLAPTSTIDAAVVTRATASSLRRLDEGFFRVRFDRLTPREKDYMRSMATLGAGPHRSGEIAEQLKASVRSVAPVRSSLISKGMIYSPAHLDRAAWIHEWLSQVTGDELRGEGLVYGGCLDKIEPKELARISAKQLLAHWPEISSVTDAQGELFANPSLTTTVVA